MASSPLLAVQHVSYQSGGQSILTDISLEVNAGECRLITGPSGCGKSTLLKIIGGLLTPDNGTLLLSGRESAAFTPEAWRQAVGYCTQTPALFGDTVYDNLAFPWVLRQKKPDKDRLRADLASLNLPEDILEKSIQSLSGGEKQRVSLIRNLQFLPQVLLLDEITSALDEENKQTVHKLIARLVKEQNLGVLWVTHDTSELHELGDVITLPARQQEEQEQERTHESA